MSSPDPAALALVIYNAHNGESLRVTKPVRFHTLAAFKAFLVETFYVLESGENVFLLTSFGMKFSFSMINDLNEVYVYDKRLFLGQHSLSQQYLGSPQVGLQGPPSAPQPPSFSATTVKTMSETLVRSQAWLHQALEHCRRLDAALSEATRQTSVVFKCLSIVFLFATNFVNGIAKSFHSYHSYVKMTALKTLHRQWPVFFGALQRAPPLKLGATIELAAMLSPERLQLSANYIATHLPQVEARFSEMAANIERVEAMRSDINAEIERLRNESRAQFKDNEVVTQGLRAQAVETLVGLLATQADGLSPLELVYHRAPQLVDTIALEAAKLSAAWTQVEQFRHQLGARSVQIFEKIATIQRQMVEVKDELKSASKPAAGEDTLSEIRRHEDYLSLTIDLPLLVGLTLVEKRRQYEWYDFLAKGVVKNVLEQLCTVIEQERTFRRLWAKKFGGFLALLGEGVFHHPKLPSIDVTLVGGEMHNDEFGKVLDGVSVERSHVLEYIGMLKEFLQRERQVSPTSVNFATVLDKNLKDMVASTNNMKRATKLVCTISMLTSPHAEADNAKIESQILALSSHQGTKLVATRLAGSLEQDLDLKVIAGLKLRISKLESLLHQQQYKDLAQWPVIRNAKEQGESVLITKSRSPTELLAGSRHAPAPVLDASTTIDKHLNNLRIKRENENLKGKVDVQARHVQAWQRAAETAEQEVARLKRQNEAKDATIESLQIEVTRLRAANNTRFEETVELNRQLEAERTRLSDAHKMKSDLLSNMSAKEQEFSQERKALEAEIVGWQRQLEEAKDDYEDLMELTQAKQNTSEEMVNELTRVGVELFGRVRQMAHLTFELYYDFCLVLESMGLLLVAEWDAESKLERMKIVRVKGLRAKRDKGWAEELGDMAPPQRATLKVVERTAELLNWVDVEFAEGGMLAALVAAFEEHFEGDNSSFEVLMRALHQPPGEKAEGGGGSALGFVAAVSKRFRDVEGFAKKLTKENRTKLLELSKLAQKLRTKISMNDFQVGDLVLFLPTRIDHKSAVEAGQTWAAFNFGLPHYFLKVDPKHDLQDKDWMVGRIGSISSHTVGDSDDNPFHLSKGVNWFYIEATEMEV